ncbi:MAG: YybH family protein [Rhizomicrobium sp.]
MKSRRTIRLLAAALFFALAAPALAAPAGDISQEWAGYWNAKNLKQIMTLYAPQPVFLANSGERWAGGAAIRRHFAEGLKQFDPRLTLTSAVSGASGALAYDSGTYDEILSPTRGGKSLHRHGNYLFLFARQRRGGWKILEQSWTDTSQGKL